MGQERREHNRLSVFGGNAEIKKVRGRGKTPSERARILNWSRGGLLLKVKSPRRGVLFGKRDPVLWEDDDLSCTLRLPPGYADIDVRVEVVRVERASDDPDHLHVGVRFDGEKNRGASLEELARALEPRNRSGRLARTGSSSKRLSSRVAAQSTSRRVSRQSGRRKKSSD